MNFSTGNPPNFGVYMGIGKEQISRLGIEEWIQDRFFNIWNHLKCLIGTQVSNSNRGKQFFAEFKRKIVEFANRIDKISKFPNCKLGGSPVQALLAHK